MKAIIFLFFSMTTINSLWAVDSVSTPLACKNICDPTATEMGNQITDLQRPVACYYDVSQMESKKNCRELNAVKKTTTRGVCVYVSEDDANLKQKRGWHWGNWFGGKSSKNRFVSKLACVNGVETMTKDGMDMRIGPTLTTARKNGAKYWVGNNEAMKQQDCAECNYLYTLNPTNVFSASHTPDYHKTEPSVCYKSDSRGIPSNPKECQTTNPQGIDYCAPVKFTTGNFHGQWWTITTNAKGTRWVPCRGGVDLVPSAEAPKRILAKPGFIIEKHEENTPLNCIVPDGTSMPCKQEKCVEAKGDKSDPPFIKTTETETTDGTDTACEAVEKVCQDDDTTIRQFTMFPKYCKCASWAIKIKTQKGCCWDKTISGVAGWAIFKNATGAILGSCKKLQIEDVGPNPHLVPVEGQPDVQILEGDDGIEEVNSATL